MRMAYFLLKNQTVTYIYKASTIPADNALIIPDTGASISMVKSTDAPLPKTGDTRSDWLILLGIAGSIGVIGLRKRS
ncbi:LPXTG cell wall anchor domain-containing protein [Listeria costaricensis]|uniref:LPXTG cell wall anchor domain-containing protein n=1 Tax=Listeria costaricensis TaxID=2026604 RepID=UPI000C06DEB0|nr:LPXTG cell wall anchor domain-containing protein [Listeria costaricensis]